MAKTGSWLAAGVSFAAEIGIDIERITPRSGIHEIANFLNWQVPIANELDFYANWTLWEASAKCVENSVFMRNNSGFEQLRSRNTNGKFTHAGKWYGMHDVINDEISYAMVLKSEFNDEMDLRFRQIEDSPDWPLPAPLPAVFDFGALNKCA